MNDKINFINIAVRQYKNNTFQTGEGFNTNVIELIIN